MLLPFQCARTMLPVYSLVLSTSQSVLLGTIYELLLLCSTKGERRYFYGFIQNYCASSLLYYSLLVVNI